MKPTVSPFETVYLVFSDLQKRFLNINSYAEGQVLLDSLLLPNHYKE